MIMTTPLQQAARECIAIGDVRALISQQLGVDIAFITDEKHLSNDLGADLFDRVELMLKIENRFAGVEITDDDVEQIQVVGDLIRHVNTRMVGGSRPSHARNRE